MQGQSAGITCYDDPWANRAVGPVSLETANKAFPRGALYHEVTMDVTVEGGKQVIGQVVGHVWIVPEEDGGYEIKVEITPKKKESNMASETDVAKTEGGMLAQIPGQEGMVAVEAQRAMAEVHAAMVVAQSRPRNEDQAIQGILSACERVTLAQAAVYEYPRGGTRVSGPSIRLAEAIAQRWGNMQFGIRELAQRRGESEVEAFAWDLQTNTRSSKTFTVPHTRYTRSGITKLTDPRDIYETVANNGARRLRAAILAVIPGDIVEMAVKKCTETMEQAAGGKPIEEQIAHMVAAFEGFGVTGEMIAERLGHAVRATTNTELAKLLQVYNSLKDNMGTVEQFFRAAKGAGTGDASQDLADDLKADAKPKKTRKPRKKAEKPTPEPVAAAEAPAPPPAPDPPPQAQETAPAPTGVKPPDPITQEVLWELAKEQGFSMRDLQNSIATKGAANTWIELGLTDDEFNALYMDMMAVGGGA